MVIFFDPETHTYTLNGEVVPSVTRILSRGFGYGDALALERGSCVHQIIQYLLEGDLDESSVDPVLAPYITAFKSFLALSGYKHREAERVVGSPTYQYCGRLDLVGDLNGRRVIVDIKTGSLPDTVGCQLQAYRFAWREMGYKADTCFSLLLRNTGKFSLKEHNDPTDFYRFLKLRKEYVQ